MSDRYIHSVVPKVVVKPGMMSTSKPFQKKEAGSINIIILADLVWIPTITEGDD